MVMVLGGYRPGAPAVFPSDASPSDAASFRTEQANLRHVASHALCRELLPRLGFFPDFDLDRSQFLLLPLPALLGPLLATLGPALLLRRPLHISVPRLGKGFLGSSGWLARRGLYHRSCGLWGGSFTLRG